LRLSALRRWADAVVVLDDVMQAEALSAGFDPRRIRRMQNGIDTATFRPSMPRLAAQKALGLEGKMIVLSMGRLSAQKNLPLLFKVFAAAARQNPSLHLLVLGDGPDREALEMLVKSLDITGRVTFAGNQADVRPYLAASDVFALPSASEGISNALLEAAAAGLVCLATPVGGNADVLDNGRCGLLLPLDDPTAWTDALLQVAASPALREKLGAAASERISSEYDFNVIGERVEKMYWELLGYSISAQKPGMNGSLAESKR
jgi:glycosyltransferase involved in cell wall biosynthesis